MRSPGAEAERGADGLSPLPGFFDRPAPVVALDVLGAKFLHDGVGGLITEVEAYDPSDPASHSFPGPTQRNQVMFGPPARIYVYRSYGIHWCVNFVCAQASAILIRALEPTDRLDEMRRRRGTDDVRSLCSGPGKLCQALGIGGEDNGRTLGEGAFALTPAPGAGPFHVGKRIGITKAVDTPWRFGVRGSRFLSRKFGEGE